MTISFSLRTRIIGGTSHPHAARSRPRASRGVRPRLESIEDRCLLSAGVLDPSFGNGAGYVTTSISQYSSGASAVLIQPDGKLVAIGDANIGTGNSSPHVVFAAVRYQPDGSLDTSFGTGGHAFADFPGASHPGHFSVAYAAALYPHAGTQNDGKIIIVGEHDTKLGAVFAIARLNADGTLDKTFGSNKKFPGEVTTTFATTGDPLQIAHSVIIQADGKIVVSGYSSSAGFVMARYNNNGTLDKTFGTGGKVSTSFPGGVASSSGTLHVGPDGKLLLVGDTLTSTHQWVVAMARYSPNGSLDTTFGSGGLVIGAVAAQNVKAAIYPAGTPHAGEIAVVGATAAGGDTVEVMRFTAAGALDTTFGSGGTTSIPLGDFPNLVIAADGKLVVSFGSLDTAYGPERMGLARYNTDGTPDTTFGTNGFVRTMPEGGYLASRLDAVTIQADGAIVGVGEVFFTEYDRYYPNGVDDSKFAVARYLAS